MSESKKTPPVPRAIIHKKILNVAAFHPTKSMEGIAAEVDGATTDLVERVLNEYGDPVDDETEQHADNENENMAQNDMKQNGLQPTVEDQDSQLNEMKLTDQQYETLRAIYAFPEASQRDIAKLLDVSGATISQRVNSIEGFGWNDRQEFAEVAVATADHDQDLHRKIEQLSLRLRTIERQTAENERESSTKSILTDPDLTHKIVQACMNADYISEEEEMCILKEVLHDCC